MEAKEKANTGLIELVELLEKHGSIELMSQLASLEIQAQSPLFSDPGNPSSENAFVLFLSGLFLKHQNLNVFPIHPRLPYIFIDNLTEYYNNFKFLIMWDSISDPSQTNSLKFHSKLGKFFADTNPRSFNFQKIEHVRTVFSTIDDYFDHKYGFKIEDALQFTSLLTDHAEQLMRERYQLGKAKFEQAIRDFNKPDNAELRQQYLDNGYTADQAAAYYANFCFLFGSEKIFLIDVDDFCRKYKLTKVKEFRNFFESLSCTFGQQFDYFKDPLSDNILIYKPFIKINDKHYFCPLLTYIYPNLDLILEYLLEHEKQNMTQVWKKYESSKSGYLEKKTYEYFARVFPKNLYRNLYYKINRERFETDLLVIFDNKILIVESKSNHLPIAARRGGMSSLETGLEKIVKTAYLQAERVKNYIQSSDIVTFENESGTNVLTLNNKNIKYQFFYVNSTLELLDSLAANPQDLDALNLFQNKNYPWSVNLYDLDIITDTIKSPVYLLHYIHQRLSNHKRGIVQSITEGEFLGYYFKHGNFYEQEYDSEEKSINRMMLGADLFDPFERHYTFEEKKPEIPSNPVSDLIHNLEKYHQLGFSDIALLLLDFPLRHKRLIKKTMKEKMDKIQRDASPDAFYIVVPALDIGFSYFTSTTTSNLYKLAKKRCLLQKYIQRVSRWAMIARNITDKKNLATVFYYNNDSWTYDPVQEANKHLATVKYFQEF